MGFYAQNVSSGLIVFVECCKEDPSTQVPFQPTKEIRDETDFYTKHKKF